MSTDPTQRPSGNTEQQNDQEREGHATQSAGPADGSGPQPDFGGEDFLDNKTTAPDDDVDW